LQSLVYSATLSSALLFFALHKGLFYLSPYGEFIFPVAMTRVKRGAVARQRRKKILQLTSGARGSNSRLFRRAQQHARKALRYAYRGRNERKRQFRRLWIVRLNAATREQGRSYSTFRHALKTARCLLNRKTLSQLAAFDPTAFASILNQVAKRLDPFSIYDAKTDYFVV
jgi:large subunit ribosomal protein L20